MIKKFMTVTVAIMCSCVLFVSIAAADAAENNGIIEGPGHETAEEAAAAYIEGMINGDIQEMLSACAVETYVENYSLEKHIEHLNVMLSPLQAGYLPSADDFSRMLNIEARKNAMVQIMKYQYLAVMGSPVLTDEYDGTAIPLNNFDSVDEMIGYVYPSDSPDIEFNGIFLPPVIVSGKFLNSRNLYNMARTAYADNAQQLDSVAALIYVNEEPWLITFGTERFGDRWYITNTNMLWNIMGMPSFQGGMAKITDVLDITNEEFDALYEELLSDGKLMELTDRISETVSKIDIYEIMTLPEDERYYAYEEAGSAIIADLLTAEEMDYLFNISNSIPAR